MAVKALIMAKFAPEAFGQLERTGKVNKALHTHLKKFQREGGKFEMPYLVTGDFDLIIPIEAPDAEKLGNLVLDLRGIPASSPAIQETRTVIYLKPIPTFASSMTARSR